MSFQRAQAEVLRARIAFATNRGSDAPPLLLAAARRLEPLDVPLARETYLDALTAALFTGRLAARARHASRSPDAALAAPAGADPRPADLLLDGLATLIADGPAAGTPPLRERVAAFARRDVEPAEALRWRWLAGRAAGFIWDYEGWDVLTASPHPGRPGGGAARGAAARAQHARRRPPLRGRDDGGGRARWRRRTRSRGRPATASRRRYGALALAAYRGREDELTRLVRNAHRGLRRPRRGAGRHRDRTG